MTGNTVRSLVCGMALITAAVTLAAEAATFTFSGGGAGGGPGYMRTKWSYLANWQGGVLPGTNDTVAFTANTGGWSGTGLDGSRVVGAIDFVFSSEFYIDPSAGGQTLTLNSGTLIKRTTGNQGFSCGIILGADAAWTNLAGANYVGGLGMNGPVSGPVAMTMNGAVSGQHSIFDMGSTLTVNSLTMGPYAMLRWTDNATNRLPDAMPILLNGGKLQYTAQNNVNSTETVGVTSFTGDVALQLSKNGTGTATFAPTSLTRANGGTVIFRPNGQVLGTDVFVKVGAGNAPAVTNGMVAPYYLTQAAYADEHSVGTDTNFVTYDGTNGFVPVATSGGTDINTAGSTAIFLATNAGNRVVTANRSLHALKIDATNNIDITQTGGPWTLSIGSGGIISRAGDEDVYPGIDFGSAPGVVYETGPGYMSTTLHGPVAGSGGFTKLGDGNITLNSSANTFTGLVSVNNGQLAIGGSGSAAGVGLNRSGSTLPLRVCEMATFNLNGHSQTIAGLDGEGTVTGAGTTLTIIRDLAVTSDFAGAIAGAGMNLVKQGNGTQILSGTSTYTGATTVTDGTLRVNGTLASAVTVSGTGTLGGSGTVTGGVGISTGAALAPGSSPGILTVGTPASPSALTMANGSTLALEINGAAPGTGYDQLVVNGTVTLTSPTLNLSMGYVPVEPAMFFLLANDGTDPISGTFAGLPEGTKISIGSTVGVLYYTGNYEMGIPALGNDIVLMVPEPATLGLLLVGAAGLVARRRRG